MPSDEIKAIDKSSVHRITSGQVVIDLQTAVKELVENSIDAGATNIEVRFKEYGLKMVEVIDNGSGISLANYEAIGLKHHTSKLASFEALPSVRTFGFRGEALSSLCALSERFTATTATQEDAPSGTVLEMEKAGSVGKQGRVARQRGTTITLCGLFVPLAVRRKEFERNAKREFGKALNLLNAYALVPCSKDPGFRENGVRLSVVNILDAGKKQTPLLTPGTTTRAAVGALWGPKALDGIVDLNLAFEIPQNQKGSVDLTPITVRGLISKFSSGNGRTGTDRQFLFVNGRPCTLTKVQKAFNEVYRTFNTGQAPFVVADFIIPSDACDINVSPDKRTIFLHNEGAFVQALKMALEETFAPARSTFTLGNGMSQTVLPVPPASNRTSSSARSQSQRQSSGTLTLPGPSSARGDTPSTLQAASSLPSSQLARFSSLAPDAISSVSIPARVAPFTSAQPNVAPVLVHKAIVDLDDSDQEDMEAPASEADFQPESSAVESQKAAIVEQSPGPSGAAPRAAANPRSSSSSVQSPAVVAPQRRDVRVELNPSSSPIASGSRVVQSVTVKDVREKPSAVPRPERAVQMVLSTTGASWNLKSDNEEGPPKKKRRSEAVLVVDEPMDLEQVMPMDVVKETGDVNEGMDETLAVESEQDEQQQLEVHDAIDVDAGVLMASDVIDLTDDIQYIADETFSGISDVNSSSDVLYPPESIRNSTDGQVSVRFDLSSVTSKWRDVRERMEIAAAATKSIEDVAGVERVPSIALDAGLDNEDDAQAQSVLSRVISKEDFGAMEIVGQFNLGFIIVRRQMESVPRMDDLFIVDQHAADEKYNFETLQKTTVLQSQRLFRPQPLELTAADEMLAMENIDILQQNGFEVDMGEEGRGMKLISQPVSKSIVFDMKDLEEIISLMHDHPAGQMVRCSKARSMFAMRACRKSVMVGHPLNRGQMTAVVQHMGTMDQPWNCPHGRPTMRHLADIANLELVRCQVDWTKYCIT